MLQLKLNMILIINPFHSWFHLEYLCDRTSIYFFQIFSNSLLIRFYDLSLNFIWTFVELNTDSNKTVSWLTNCFVIEDLWIASIRIASSKLPDVKERLPVNVWYQLGEVVVFICLGSGECGYNYTDREAFTIQIMHMYIQYITYQTNQWQNTVNAQHINRFL